MHKLVAASSGHFVRSFNSSLFNFTATAISRANQISGTTGGTSTTQDIVLNSITGATVDNEFDVVITAPLNLPLVINNLTPGIISFNNLSATRIADGIASLLFTCGKMLRRVDFAVSRSGGVTTTSFNSFAAGSLGDYLATTIAGLLSGKTAPNFTFSGNSVSASSTICDIFNSDGTRNTHGWWGSLDLTCIPQSIGDNGILVTPRDMLFANHFGVTPFPSFRDNANNVYQRQVVASRRVGLTDILVATLNADLPAGIAPANVLQSNWRSWLPNPSYGYPCIFTNQDRRLLIGDTAGAETIGAEMLINQSRDATRNPWFYGVRLFDSGSAAAMPINGSLAALLDWHSSGSGPNDADNISGINAAITANGSPYSLTTANLTGFTGF